LFKNIISSNMDKLSMDKPEPLHDPPNCINCGEKVWFSCTEIEKPGFVHHVYECKKCRSDARSYSLVSEAPLIRVGEDEYALQSLVEETLKEGALRQPSVARGGSADLVQGQGRRL
jgi:hypothetical protein